MNISMTKVVRFVFIWAVLVVSSANGVSAVEEKPSAFELRRVVSDGENVASETLPWEKRSGERDLKVAKKPLVDKGHVEKAVVVKNPLTGNDEVKVTLTKEGAELFSNATRENIGKKLAVVSGGKVLMAPVINTEISGGTLMISGNLSTQEAQELASLLSPKKD